MRVRKLKPKVKKDTREMKVVYRHDRKAVRALGGKDAMTGYAVKEFEFMGYWQGKKLWRPDCWLVPVQELAKVGAVPISSHEAYVIREKQKATGREVYARRIRAAQEAQEALRVILSAFPVEPEDDSGAPVPIAEIGAGIMEDENAEPFDVDTCGFMS